VFTHIINKWPLNTRHILKPGSLHHRTMEVTISNSRGRRGRDHCSWIYNYICNQCISPVKLWIRIRLMT